MTGKPSGARAWRVPTLALLMLALGCAKREARAPQPARDTARVAPTVADTAARADSAARDSARRDSTAARDTVAALPTYIRLAVHDAKHLHALIDSLGPARWRDVLRVNRVDLEHVRDRDSLIVPLAGDSLAFAPFPPSLDAVRDTTELLLVSLRVQAFAAYDSGRLVRWGPTSTGRRDKPTPVGVYHTNWKDKDRVSTFDEAWLLHWYVNLGNSDGVSLHQYELPGRPASHACVRLLADDAEWMYGWARNWKVAEDRRTVVVPGTPVVVFGTWNWHARAPWKRLPEDPDATTLSTDELQRALDLLRSGARPALDSAQVAALPDSTRRSMGLPPLQAPSAGSKSRARSDSSRVR